MLARMHYAAPTRLRHASVSKGRRTVVLLQQVHSTRAATSSCVTPGSHLTHGAVGGAAVSDPATRIVERILAGRPQGPQPTDSALSQQ
jgi:hypothetical protein